MDGLCYGYRTNVTENGWNKNKIFGASKSDNGVGDERTVKINRSGRNASNALLGSGYGAGTGALALSGQRSSPVTIRGYEYFFTDHVNISAGNSTSSLNVCVCQHQLHWQRLHYGAISDVTGHTCKNVIKNQKSDVERV